MDGIGLAVWAQRARRRLSPSVGWAWLVGIEAIVLAALMALAFGLGLVPLPGAVDEALRLAPIRWGPSTHL